MISLTLATALTGGTLVAGEIASYFIKKSNKSTDKMANAELKDEEELKNFTGNNGLVLSKNIQLKEKADYEGILITAPTG